MPSDWQPQEPILLGILGVGILTAALMAGVRILQLQFEVRSVRLGERSGMLAYQRYRSRMDGWDRASNLCIVAVPFIGGIGLGDPHELITTPYFLCLLACALTVPILLYNLLTNAFVYSTAHITLLKSSANRRSIVAQRLRRDLLANVNFFVISMGWGIVLLAQREQFLWLPLWFTIGYTAVSTLYDGTLTAWRESATPIEKTKWASLAPRVQEWARLANVPIHRVMVTSGLSPAYGSVVVAGIRDCRLFFRDYYLEKSDWRQQDFVTCWAIISGRNDKARLVYDVIFSTVFLGGAIILAMATPVFFPPPSTSSQASTVPELIPYLRTTVLLVSLLFAPGLSVRLSKRFLTKRLISSRRADLRAVALTGDPAAPVVSGYTMDGLKATLNDPIAKSPNTAVVRAEMRYRSLQKVPVHAPYADAPVPAAFPLTVDGRLLTVPLESAPPPAPVPTAPYPSLMPPAPP